jgi:DNA-binding transcriptional regulator LsrR (DeoR family)
MPRETAGSDRAQMQQVARMFYKDRIDKKKIGTQLGLDPRKVTALLEQAEQAGIVRITVDDETNTGLESGLMETFRCLKRVSVIECQPVKTATQYKEFLISGAKIAAEQFEKFVEGKSGDCKAVITGGETALAFANAVTEAKRPNLYIYAAAFIGRGKLAGPGPATHIDAATCSNVLWSRSGHIPGKVIYATVPPFPRSDPGFEARKAARTQLEGLAALGPICEVLDEMTVDKIDIAISSVGTVKLPEDAPPELRDRLGSISLVQSIVSPEELIDEGVIGESSYCYFNSDGNGSDRWQFFLTAGHNDPDEKRRGLGFYKEMVKAEKPVIVIAGPFKEAAVRAALEGDLINWWVTDESTAKLMLEEKRGKN